MSHRGVQATTKKLSSSSCLSTSKTSTNDAGCQKEESYTVLYYKRKNKVHKSKGVSKKDGVLTVVPPPKATVVLQGGNQTVFKGIQREIAKRILQVDDIVVLGSYEVEILSRDTAVSSTTIKGKPKPAVLLPRKRTSFSRVRGPLHPKANGPLANVVLRTTGSVGRSKPSCRPLPQPPPQPFKEPSSPIYALSDNETSSDDDPDHGLASDAKKENNYRTVPLRRGSTKRSASLAASTATISRSKIRGVPPHKKQALLSASTSRRATGLQPLRQRQSMAAGTGSSAPTIFPGAIGRVDVPHSIKGVLKPHQVEGVAFLWNCLTGHGKACAVSPHVDVEHGSRQSFKGAILADEMGLGKTLMTIAVICALHRQRRDTRFVVVCPSSLVANWAKEFDKWLGKACQPKRAVIKKGGEEAINQIKALSTVRANQPQVIIISYDLFRMNASLFQQIKKVGLLVVDEGHRLKNTAGSLTLTALESLPCEARLCITATPIQNILSDFFNIANFVCPGLLGDLPTFRKEYERPISASNNKSCSSKQKQRGLTQSRILDDITRTFMLRRLQKDILKTMLPPRAEVLLFCRPTSMQCQLYKQITNQHGTSGSIGATSDALTALTNLRKICAHPALFVDTTLVGTNSSSGCTTTATVNLSGKLKLLDALLTTIRAKAPQDKVVVVSNYTSALSIIEDRILKARGLTYIRLDGSTELSNRQGIVDLFNKTSAQRSFAFLLSSKAGGCGLNLIGANRLVMFDPDWNPASDIQAMARVYRQGQVKPCIIYRLFTSGTIEEVICQRQMQKGNLATLTVDGAIPKSNGASGGFTKEELRDCFTLKEACDCDTKLKIGSCWPSYDGPASIESQGCSDPPLLSIASDETIPLAFVHVVNQELEKAHTNCTEKDQKKALTETSEEEFKCDNDERSLLVQSDSSSEEEFEF